jgi:hypothetical protein
VWLAKVWLGRLLMLPPQQAAINKRQKAEMDKPGQIMLRCSEKVNSRA